MVKYKEWTENQWKAANLQRKYLQRAWRTVPQDHFNKLKITGCLDAKYKDLSSSRLLHSTVQARQKHFWLPFQIFITYDQCSISYLVTCVRYVRLCVLASVWLWLSSSNEPLGWSRWFFCASHTHTQTYPHIHLMNHHRYLGESCLI